jgi:hypothetical protein
MKIFGKKLNLAFIFISLLIGFLACSFTFCSCGHISKKEGFNIGSAPLNYRLGEGVPGDTWTSAIRNTHYNMYASLDNNIAGTVPLPSDELFFFYKNEFSPDCCYKPQQYSSSTGCACMSPSQMKYISSRGGNNTLP